MKLPFPAHSDGGAYVFVSYAHINSDIVYPEMLWMHKAGINIWYDEGITPGSRWSEELAGAIEECTMFLVFLTEASVRSENCLNEIDFALRRKRPFLAVELEPVELPPGIELNIGNRQSILKYRFTEDHYRTRLLSALEAARKGESADPSQAHIVPDSRIPPPDRAPRTVRRRGSGQAAETATSRAFRFWPVLLALLVLAAGVAFYLRSPADAASEEASIAVLPFENISGDPDIDYLADGLADELITLLGGVTGLSVSSRTSSFYYRNQPALLTDIRSRLGVSHAIEGSIRPEQQRLIISIALFRTDNGQQIWSRRFETGVEAVSSVPAQAAAAITRHLRPEIRLETVPSISRDSPVSAGAYQAYLKGLDFLSQPPSPEVLSAAQLHFEQAIREQPDFARGYAALCETHLVFFRMVRSEDVDLHHDRAKEHCDRAITLDATLAASHKSLAVLYRDAGRFPEALKEIRLANTLQPNSAAIHHELGKILAVLDQPERAEVMLRRAIELDQGFWGGYADLGDFLYERGRYTEALEQFKKVHELTPMNGLALVSIGATEYMLENVPAAEAAWREALTESPESESRAFWQAATWMGISRLNQGCYEDAAYWQQQAIRMSPNDHRLFGRLAESCQLQLGSPDAAIDEVSRTLYRRAIMRADEELNINPNDWESIGSKALYLARSGDTEGTDAMIERMLKLQPGNPDALELALLYAHQIGDLKSEERLRGQLQSLNYPSRLLQTNPFLSEATTCRVQSAITERLICTMETVIPAYAE
ncbi:MAG: TIR domain-containing protein [Pseudomonadales bacterium]|nr:TIR domain-containing protein [Pseudomonadales bacterium]